MGTLTAFSIDGMKIWFWSNDHNPPHFHAKRDGLWEYRVFFLEEKNSRMMERVWGKSISATDRKLLKNKVTQYRVAILKEWELKVQP